MYADPSLLSHNKAMKKKCTVKLTDIQIEEGERQAVEITTQGTYEWTDEGYTVRFEELFDEGVRSMTTVRSCGGDCVTVVHSGDITTELTVELGKRHNCHYVTPYGELLIGIDAVEITDELTETGGTLKMIYSIDYYAAVAAMKEITLTIIL